VLEVTVIADSPVAEIFATKCCGGGLPDQNLEIRIVNRGAAAVTLQSRFRLEGTGGDLDWNAVCPAGGRSIAPGDVAAFYADMDPARLARFQAIVLFDDHGKGYRFPLAGGKDIEDTAGKGPCP
jgi:hypothetical protein